MGAYQPLFSIKVTHNYFLDARCRDLRFVPSADFDDLTKKIGLLLRASQSGIAVFYDEERLDALVSYAKDKHRPLRFGFRVFCGDSHFQNYTDLNPPKDKPYLILRNRYVQRGEQEVLSLHANEFVDAGCYWSSDVPSFCEKDKLQDLTPEQRVPCEQCEWSEVLNSLLTPSDKKASPCFLLSIDAVADGSGLFDSEFNVTPRDFVINFNSRECYWKYYLIGDVRDDQPVVVNMDDKHQVAFSSLTEEWLPDGRHVWSAISESMLEVREYSDYHFQLKTAANGGGKVLIKRLPVAPANRVTQAVIDGEKVFLSEIFVNF